MKKTSFIFFAILFLLACKKDKDYWANEERYDLNFFLMQTNNSFEGKMDGKTVSWVYGRNVSKASFGYQNANGFCDSTDPSRILLSGLTIPSQEPTQFCFFTPMYYSNIERERNQIFSTGKKKLGDLSTNYCFVFKIGDTEYISSSKNADNKLEILKAEAVTGLIGKKCIRVWFRIKANLIPYRSSKKDTHDISGLLLLEFWGLRFGE
jgi:hypothetical protein